MDGFAVTISDLAIMASETGLPIATNSTHEQYEARIGHPPIAMPDAYAVRIVTGAPIALGSDLVVRHEDVRSLGLQRVH
jgi:molybdopterin biosynthesis enzyme